MNLKSIVAKISHYNSNIFLSQIDFWELLLSGHQFNVISKNTTWEKQQKMPAAVGGREDM